MRYYYIYNYIILCFKNFFILYAPVTLTVFSILIKIIDFIYVVKSISIHITLVRYIMIFDLKVNTIFTFLHKLFYFIYLFL